MVYERRNEPLLSPAQFYTRMAWHSLLGGAVLLVSLGVGVVGYHVLADLPWVDALENAAMILSGMGPVDTMATDTTKVFAALYALFSGIVFISSVGVMAAPILHRVLHHFHIEQSPDRGSA